MSSRAGRGKENAHTLAEARRPFFLRSISFFAHVVLPCGCGNSAYSCGLRCRASVAQPFTSPKRQASHTNNSHMTAFVSLYVSGPSSGFTDSVTTARSRAAGMNSCSSWPVRCRSAPNPSAGKRSTFVGQVTTSPPDCARAADGGTPAPSTGYLWSRRNSSVRSHFGLFAIARMSRTSCCKSAGFLRQLTVTMAHSEMQWSLILSHASRSSGSFIFSCSLAHKASIGSESASPTCCIGGGPPSVASMAFECTIYLPKQ